MTPSDLFIWATIIAGALLALVGLYFCAHPDALRAFQARLGRQPQPQQVSPKIVPMIVAVLRAEASMRRQEALQQSWRTEPGVSMIGASKLEREADVWAQAAELVDEHFGQEGL